MKIARTICLAALAALALTAFAGASSASAAPTTLCKTNTSAPFCASADRYPAGTALKASSGKVTLNSSSPKLIGTITCESSILEGETSAASGEPLPLAVSAWSLSGCKKTRLGGESSQSCSITSVHLPYAGSLTRTSGSNGTLTLSDGGSGQPGWYVECPESIECTYTFDPDFSFTGGNPAKMTVAEESLAGDKEVSCPTLTIAPATYTVDSPKPAYAAAGEVPTPTTGLCSSLQKWCEPGNLYGAGTKIEAASSEVVFDNSWANGGDIVCGKGTLTAETTAAYGEPLPIKNTSFSLGECRNSSFNFNCSVETLALYTGSLSRTAFTGDGSWNGGGASWFAECGEVMECTYTIPSGSVITLDGSNSPVFKINKVKLAMKGESGELCPAESFLSGNFTITTPKPLFVTDVVR